MEVGIRSTAVLFGNAVVPATICFGLVMLGLLYVAGVSNSHGQPYFVTCIGGTAAFFLWKFLSLDVDSGPDCWSACNCLYAALIISHSMLQTSSSRMHIIWGCSFTWVFLQTTFASWYNFVVFGAQTFSHRNYLHLHRWSTRNRHRRSARIFKLIFVLLAHVIHLILQGRCCGNFSILAVIMLWIYECL